MGTDTCKCTHMVKVTITADQKGLNTHNSSLEGATKLKFVSFCSPLDALSDGNFQLHSTFR